MIPAPGEGTGHQGTTQTAALTSGGHLKVLPGWILHISNGGSMQDERPDFRPVSGTWTSHRLQLHFLEWGEPSAPPVLLVHGVRDHARNWDWVAARLARDFRVIVPDMRGHGDSEWAMGSNYGLLDHVFDLSQLLEQQQLQGVHVIAHSLGATHASVLAGVWPGRMASLTLIEGVAGLHHFYKKDHSVQSRIRSWIKGTAELADRQPRRYRKVEEAVERLQRAHPHLDPHKAEHLARHGARRNGDGTWSWKYDNYTRSRSPFDFPYDQMVELWEEISCPVLMINGSRGYPFRIGQNGSDAFFRNSRVVEIPDAGHWVHHDQLEPFMGLLQEFLPPGRAAAPVPPQSRTRESSGPA